MADREPPLAGPSRPRYATMDVPLLRDIQVASKAGRQRHSNSRSVRQATQADLQAKLASLEQQLAALAEERQRTKGKLSELQLAEAEEEMEIEVLLANGTDSGEEEVSSDSFSYADDFPWTIALKTKLQQIFKIQDFQHCQAGACNAAIDQRNMICIMPTGGGKSLCYQLPALLSVGCTIVISPLLALIEDQIAHLKQHKIRCAKVIGSNAQHHAQILRNIMDSYSYESRNEIKLIYTTPETLCINHQFKAMLGKLFQSKKLARIVIDEAQCIAQLGHHFRPHFQQIKFFIQELPGIPITATTATCTPMILATILKELSMNSAVSGYAVPRNDHSSTILFTSSSNRPNLCYSVIYKMQTGTAEQQIQVLTMYILHNHSGQSGIVYAYSISETEKLAEHIARYSKNKIKTGAYHAKLKNNQKAELYRQWKHNKIHVICATTAFGLGIDKSDVRFVIHFTLPKDIIGFYQESGRAGRDGANAKCILYYRPQDVLHVAALLSTQEKDASSVHSMIAFAQNLEQCRTTQFLEAFQLDNLPGMPPQEVFGPCNNCDNCARNPDTITTKDVTFASWIIINSVVEHKKMTLTNLLKAATNSALWKGIIDPLHTKDLEWLCMKLVVDKYMKFTFSGNSYRVNVYLTPGDSAETLTKRNQADVQGNSGPRIHCTFDKTLTTRKKWTRRVDGGKGKGTKRRAVPEFIVISDSEDGDVEDIGEEEEDLGMGHLAIEISSDEGPESSSAIQASPSKRRRVQPSKPSPEVITISSDSE